MKKECEYIKNILNDYLDNLLSYNEKAFLEKHLEKCKECSEELNSLKKISNAIKEIKRVSVPEEEVVKLKNKIKMESMKENRGFLRAFLKEVSLRYQLNNLFEKKYIAAYAMCILAVLTITMFIFISYNKEEVSRVADKAPPSFIVEKERKIEDEQAKIVSESSSKILPALSQTNKDIKKNQGKQAEENDKQKIEMNKFAKGRNEKTYIIENELKEKYFAEENAIIACEKEPPSVSGSEAKADKEDNISGEKLAKSISPESIAEKREAELTEGQKKLSELNKRDSEIIEVPVEKLTFSLTNEKFIGIEANLFIEANYNAKLNSYDFYLINEIDDELKVDIINALKQYDWKAFFIKKGLEKDKYVMEFKLENNILRLIEIER